MPNRRASLIAEVDPAELAIRMCEANYGIRRPAGLTAAQSARGAG